MLPYYISIGVSKAEFMDSSPRELEPYIRAHKLKREELDEAIWMMCGHYVLSAVSVAVEHCLNGKKAKSKYIEEPILKTAKEQNGELTEEELQEQREMFVAMLRAKKANFDIHHNHKKKEEEQTWQN